MLRSNSERAVSAPAFGAPFALVRDIETIHIEVLVAPDRLKIDDIEARGKALRSPEHELKPGLADYLLRNRAAYSERCG